MKKYIATLFVLFLGTSVMGSSNSDPAVKSGCPEPKTCTLWESEACYRKQGQFIGDDVCLECSCPDGGETKILMDEKSGLSLTTLCCKGLDEYDSEAKAYRPSTNCGCSESETFHIYNGESYCCNDAGYGRKGYSSEIKFRPEACGCPRFYGEEVLYKDGRCCGDVGAGFSSIHEIYIHDVKCCPQKDDETVEMINGLCCVEGKAYDTESQDYTTDVTDCGCPENKKYRLLKLRNETTSDYRRENYLDSEYNIVEAEEQGCCFDTLHKWHDIDICCKSVPVCTPEEGVVIPWDWYKGECACGCLMDKDCNMNETGIELEPNETKPYRICYKNKCVNDKEGCFEVDGIKIEYDSVTQIKEEDLQAYIERIKSELKVSPEDTFTIKFTMMSCTIFGFVSGSDTQTIKINSTKCCWLPNGALSCEGTILHENKHRINALKQIKWNSEFKTQLARAYQDILDEIDAHAVGDINRLKNYYETCYPDYGGMIHDVCLDDKDGEVCALCRRFYIPSYIADYFNKEMAEKYYLNKEIFDSCEERKKIEMNFLNSEFCRTEYIEKQAKNISCIPDDRIDNQEEFYQDIRDAMDACNIVPPEELDLTDLPVLIAELYQKNGSLCITPEEFASSKNMNLGLIKLSECEIMYNILASNSGVSDWKEIAQACRNEQSCVKGEEITFTSN